ncbi:hypothetical protein ACFL5Q_03440 [Planctomycetota bacterium]
MKIKIDRELYDKLSRCAVAGGYSSTDEFVQHVLEREVEQVLGQEISPEDEEKVKARLRGLGYLS